ncbi:cilia- and flagella-associated protein 43-like [Amphiprion ocellaris]|uniref:cilia- and flagella-associated protein 43-like n=1 Tax=Amphiprion ocellaris TaxID=80972 RepID=UPI002410CAA9|nr:cilia- and flagella-associated protein 43-like [Amphiprion ocellaris]
MVVLIWPVAPLFLTTPLQCGTGKMLSHFVHNHMLEKMSFLWFPLNWYQLCALGATSLTVWNIEKSASFHVLKPSTIEFPAKDGSIIERLSPTLHMTKPCTRARLTPSAICWTATSELYVGCEEGFLLLVDPESLSVSLLFNPTTADATSELQESSFQSLTFNKNNLIAVGKVQTHAPFNTCMMSLNITDPPLICRNHALLTVKSKLKSSGRTQC